MNFSPGCGYPRTGAIHCDFIDQKAASAPGDHWKVCISSVSWVTFLAMPVNPVTNLQY
jgi:hypothetical protein